LKAQHQSLLHFVGIATRSDQRVLAKVREKVPAIEKDGPIDAWIIDGTSFPKQPVVKKLLRAELFDSASLFLKQSGVG
jgi:SRSO17 transposase